MFSSTLTKPTLTLSLFLVVIQSQGVKSEKISVCYYRNWAQYYTGKANFFPENIDVNLCSVVNYAFMVVNLNTHKLEGRQRNDDEMLQRLNNLKKQKPTFKVFLSVGKYLFKCVLFVFNRNLGHY